MNRTAAVALSILLAISFLATADSRAFAGEGPASPGYSRELPPARLAQVVYQENPDHGTQVYIVAQAHRSALSGNNNTITEKVQAEIYRIGEWLIQNKNVAVLLPEGYFQRQPSSPPVTAEKCGSNTTDRLISRLDDTTLHNRLADTSRYVNADMLLSSNFNVSLHQIEDKAIYSTVFRLLSDLFTKKRRKNNEETLMAMLAYQQKMRTAAILQNIPKALTGAGTGSDQCPRNAILTMGMAHVRDMLRFLKSGRVEIDPLLERNDDFGGYSVDLSELKKTYGITIIVPRTLLKKYAGFASPAMLADKTPET